MKVLDYLPKNFQDDELMKTIADLMEQASISDEDIEQVLYRFDPKVVASNLDYVISEMGFKYVSDPFSLTNEQKTMFIFMLYILNKFKGRKEGVDLVFQLLGLTYTIKAWHEKDPIGTQFTYDVHIEMNTEFISANFLSNLRTFLYNYLLPIVETLSVEYFLEMFNLITGLAGFLEIIYQYEEVIQFMPELKVTAVPIIEYSSIKLEV